jgi:hypothetical protein
MRITRFLAASALSITCASAFCTVLTLPGLSRSRDTVIQQADSLVRQFALNSARLTASARATRQKAGLYHPEVQFSLPAVVVMPGNVISGGRHTLGNGLQLQFDSSGAEAFPTSYQTLLQSIFNAAEPTLNAFFGTPAIGGVVHVANFDATIGDRQAIAGGYYLPDNGSSVPEIRFPVYNANEATAVNFIHTLLLAYLGPEGYGNDAFEEGLVRAVVMRVVRTSGALPTGLDPTVIQETLDNSYDIGPAYAWNNQRALGGNPFIAANLVSAPLPSTGGSGPYLLRYLMSGSAWAKVLVEYPTFAAQLNGLVYANPNLGNDVNGLINAGQSILNSLNPASPTVEGLSFAQWFQRQFILETGVTQGNKLLVQATPVTSGLSGSDFGVFLLEAIYFNTDSSGNETLLSGTSYPIYWDNTFARLNTSAQDEVINIISSDGTVGPNFPDQNGGQPYGVSIDVPVGAQSVRVVVPAGAIATATKPTPNDFYGTVEGVGVQSGDSLVVRVTVGANVFSDIPVTNGAFGATLGSTANYNGYATVDVKVIRTRGGTATTLFEQLYDKQPGSLGVDLRVGGEATFAYPSGLASGISMVGLPIDPFISLAPTLFNILPTSLLLAQYDSAIGGYHLYPNTSAPSLGHAFFIRPDVAQGNFSITGRQSPNVSTTVALKPGWNMMSVPLPYAFDPTTLRVVHAADFPLAYTDSIGTLIGTDIFQFVPGAADPASGVPEGGTFIPATTLNPGIGYFVRVLSAEGVSLTFDPPASQLASRRREAALLSGTALAVRAKQNGQLSYVVLGVSPQGSRTLNLAVDSELPPSIGGFQASVQGSKGTLFRDVRPMNGAQSFTVELDGLIPGQPAKITFALQKGFLRTFKVINQSTGQVRTMLVNETLNFTPKSASQRFTVIVGGR